jgi:hypothetical protein
MKEEEEKKCVCACVCVCVCKYGLAVSFIFLLYFQRVASGSVRQGPAIRRKAALFHCSGGAAESAESACQGEAHPSRLRKELGEVPLGGHGREKIVGAARRWYQSTLESIPNLVPPARGTRISRTGSS